MTGTRTTAGGCGSRVPVNGLRPDPLGPVGRSVPGRHPNPSAGDTYDRVRAACCDVHGLYGDDALDRHARAVTLTVLMRQRRAYA